MSAFRLIRLFALPVLLGPQLPAFAGEKLEGGGVVLARSAVTSGGERSAAGGFRLQSALGEAVFSPAAAGAYKTGAGYIPLSAQPGSVISIAALTKSTGSLRLAWTAPGADGALGRVLNGVYRVDYSSSPAHRFRPSVFRLELSTSVVPGMQEALDINGLEPNTTYYAKIYLGDAARFMAEDSSFSRESTLANIPVNPFFSAVTVDSVTISWLLPAGGAEGYGAEGSSTNFSGGDLAAGMTPQGLELSLTLGGLAPGTTYYFKVASRNWQGDRNYGTIIATVTPGGLPARALAVLPNAMSRAVTLNWANPAGQNPQKALVILSVNPVTPAVMNGMTFYPGQTLGDGSLVRFNGKGNTFTDAGLTLDIPYYYHVYNQYSSLIYSVSVSTSVFLDLPPLAPAGLAASVNTDRTQAVVSWSNVTSNVDGSSFLSPSAPRAVELARYRVDRATSAVNSAWVSVATVPAASLSYTDLLPAPDLTYFYRVSAIDSLGTEDTAMLVDTEQRRFAVAPDGVTRLQIPPALAGELLAAANAQGKNLIIRAVEESSGDAPTALKTVRFEAVITPDNKVVKDFKFERPELSVVMGYDVAGGRIVASGARPTPGVSLSAADAPRGLGMYWNNGDKYMKLYGSVDPASQTVSVRTSMMGSYQLRTLYRDSGVSFDISNLNHKAITPNGDGLNDTSVFTFDNPRDSAFAGRIYDLSGAFVAEMSPGPVANSLQWDGRAGGRAAAGGVYAYQIKAESKVFNGTLLVIR